jgi:hypothetical protein
MPTHEDFSEDIKRKVLLWSDRHCCVCGKAYGIDIEVAHIEPEGKAAIDNAIPSCYECHADIGRYWNSHPRGNKYRVKELKQRRDQIYERYTNGLVPGLVINMHPRAHEVVGAELLQVVCSIQPVGRFIPVRPKVIVQPYLGLEHLATINDVKPYYGGGIIWNLNAGVVFTGNFTLPKECAESKDNLTIQLDITCIDPYEREHKRLPECFTYYRGKYDGDLERGWYLEPTSFAELKRYIKAVSKS